MSRFDIVCDRVPEPEDPSEVVVANTTSNGLCNAMAEILPDRDYKKVMDILRDNRFFSKLGAKTYEIYQLDAQEYNQLKSKPIVNNQMYWRS